MFVSFATNRYSNTRKGTHHSSRINNQTPREGVHYTLYTVTPLHLNDLSHNGFAPLHHFEVQQVTTTVKNETFSASEHRLYWCLYHEPAQQVRFCL